MKKNKIWKLLLFMTILVLMPIRAQAWTNSCQLSIVATGKGYLNNQGHVWLSVYNSSNSVIAMGEYDLSPGGTATIGLWPSVGTVRPGGAYINRELYLRSTGQGYTSGCVTHTVQVNAASIGTVIRHFANNSYYDGESMHDGIKHNCTTLAIEAWNMAVPSSERLPKGSIFDAPVDLKNWLIKNKGEKEGPYQPVGSAGEDNVYYMASDQKLFSVTEKIYTYTALELGIGEKAKVTRYYGPVENNVSLSKYMTFKSKSPSVATVSASGEVTALKSGTAVIEMTLWRTMTASITVKVAKPQISLSRGKLTVTKGCKEKLAAQIRGGKGKITWKSSNSKVASVRSTGDLSVEIEGKKPGKATITASFGSVKAKCTVTVKQPTISLSEKKLVLYSGSYLKLTAKVVGASSNVTWKSSNSKIVDVNDGWIKAKNEGTATVKATANGVTATCKITVKPTISLSKNSISLTVNQTEALKAVVKGSSKKVKWTSSNKKIATVDSKGNVTAKKKGICIIRAKLGKLSVNCTVKVEDNQEYKKLYYDFLKQGEKSFTFKLFSNNYTDKARSFWLLNLNDDDIPELIVSIDSSGQETLAIYTISNHKVAYCGFICDKGSSRYNKKHRALHHSWWTNGNGGAGEKLLRVEGTTLKVYKYCYAYNKNGKRVYKTGDNETNAQVVSAGASAAFHKKWFDKSYLESRVMYTNNESVRLRVLK